MISEMPSSWSRSWIGPKPTISEKTASCSRSLSVLLTATCSSSRAVEKCSATIERIASTEADSMVRPRNAATRLWIRLTSWTSLSSRKRLSFSTSGRQSASDVTEATACLCALRSGGCKRPTTGRRMLIVRSSRQLGGRHRPTCPSEDGRLEAVRDDLRELAVASAGFRAGSFVEDRDPPVDRLGDADPLARDRRGDRAPEAFLDLRQADACLSRDPVRHEKRALVLQEQPGRAHDTPQVPQRR